MPKKQPIVAILYDFDKTLATDDMQNFSFIPTLGMTPAEFWGETDELAKKTGMEKILSYMYMMIEKAKEKNIPLTKEFLNKLGKDVKLYEGVSNWFKRINAYAEELGVKDKDIVSVKIESNGRSLIFGDVVARVNDSYALAMHIDTDESNAVLAGPTGVGTIVK